MSVLSTEDFKPGLEHVSSWISGDIQRPWIGGLVTDYCPDSSETRD